MISYAGPSRCGRCGHPRHLVEDDGPPVCRRCIYAWGWYAGRLSGSAGERREPSYIELVHRSRHVVPIVSCAFCRIEGTARKAS